MVQADRISVHLHRECCLVALGVVQGVGACIAAHGASPALIERANGRHRSRRDGHRWGVMCVRTLAGFIAKTYVALHSKTRACQSARWSIVDGPAAVAGSSIRPIPQLKGEAL